MLNFYCSCCCTEHFGDLDCSVFGRVDLSKEFCFKILSCCTGLELAKAKYLLVIEYQMSVSYKENDFGGHFLCCDGRYVLGTELNLLIWLNL